MKAKKLNNKKVLLVIILPIIFSVMLFYPYEIDLGNPKKLNGLQFYEIPDFQMLNNGNFLVRVVRSIFSTPFDLKWYTLTIRDLSKYCGAVNDPGFNFSLYFNEKTIGRGEIPRGKSTKETIYLENSGKLFFESYFLFYGDDFTNRSIEAHFNATIHPAWPDSISRMILFFISWNLIAILRKDVLNYIKT